MDKKRLVYKGQTYYHGDEIKATLVYCDEDVEVVGKLCINHDNYDADGRYYICQNECDGDSSAEEKFEYKYSWHFSLTDDCMDIRSTDTKDLELLNKPDIFEEEDVMPEDWVMDEIIPDDL
jgi:hypothetical protein